MNKRLTPIRWLWPLLLAGLGPLQAGAGPQPAVQRAVRPTPVVLVKGTGPAYGRRPDAMALADDIARQYGLNRQWVRHAIARARRVPEIEKLVLPQPVTVPKNWQQYRGRFLTPERIEAGVTFWQTYRDALQRAQATYGVPPEIIVGILGVETYFGRHMGRYRVIDTLATLAFDFPAEHPRAEARSAFFRKELGAFLSLRRTAHIDPLKLRGSYAGALGIPQFMPSSWASYAVDFDGDGRIDLLDSMPDAIGSVANYFHSHKWQPGMPPYYHVDFDYARLDMDTLLAPDIRPSFPVEQFTAKGAVLGDAARQHPGPLALVELQNGDYSPSYVAGTENFYVITRYNWSSYYAMAVIELGQAIAAALPADVAPRDLQAHSMVSDTGCSASSPGAASATPLCR